MPLSLRPSSQTSRLYGQHAYSSLVVHIAIILICIPIFFFGIINIMQIVRDDVTLLTHQGSEYRSSVLKCLATFLDTVPSSMTVFYAFGSVICWTFYIVYPAVALCADVVLIVVWITTLILQIRGFDYFILEKRFSLEWTSQHADNWNGTYELVRHNTTTVVLFQRLMIVGGFVVLLLSTYQAILNLTILYGTAFSSSIRLPTEYFQIEFPVESNQPQDEEVARKVPMPDNDEPAHSTSRGKTFSSGLKNLQSFFSTRSRRSSSPAYMFDPATGSTVARNRADTARGQSIWTSIRTASSRISHFTLAPSTPYFPIHLSPRTSMDPPGYSPQGRIDLPSHQIDHPAVDSEEAEVMVPSKVEDGNTSSSTEESLHFSDRVERDGDEVVLEEDTKDVRGSGSANGRGEDTREDATIDIDAIVARITKEQEERFQARLAEQARRFGELLARAMMTGGVGTGGIEAT